ncbi:hypothetical protein BJP27_24400 (plasmid) [Pseudomonas oryzihabitans]|nr:hypothetical protein BJP27_24400 [Pseudomonas psychrotolerans]
MTGETMIAVPLSLANRLIAAVDFGMPGRTLADELRALVQQRAVNAPPAASSHGEAAAQYRLLRVGEIILATDELLRDDCATWQAMSDGPQLGIGHEWHAGLVPMRRAEVCERDQGDGGEA